MQRECRCFWAASYRLERCGPCFDREPTKLEALAESTGRDPMMLRGFLHVEIAKRINVHTKLTGDTMTQEQAETLGWVFTGDETERIVQTVRTSTGESREA